MAGYRIDVNPNLDPWTNVASVSKVVSFVVWSDFW